MIRQCYEKFLIWFNKSKPKNKINKDIAHKKIAYVNFELLDNYSVNIDLSMPQSSFLDPVAMAAVSERYAEFLFLINQGLFKDRILDILKKEVNPDDDNSYLLSDNIITFWGLLYDEHKKLKKEYLQTHQPLIKPSQVFKLNT
jgi:hypothetical protein